MTTNPKTLSEGESPRHPYDDDDSGPRFLGCGSRFSRIGHENHNVQC